MRPDPATSPPPVTKRKDANLVVQRRRYDLLTPLFGGGVKPGEVDSLDQTVIRGASVRGHLRFWWRACRGGAFGNNLATLKQAEERLWGGPSTKAKPRPSQVQIAVSVDDAGKPEVVFGRGRILDKSWNDLAYAAFPLQTSDQAVRSGVKFTLDISFPNEERQGVEAALWAWQSFGGIGARTRRGFGALKLVDTNGKVAEQGSDRGALLRALMDGLGQHVIGGWLDDSHVPHLPQPARAKLIVTGPHPNARAAWAHLIARLRDFRQMRTGGRFGRSVWPEADLIRQIVGRNAGKRKPAPAVEKFPRAQFGLPIITHFKDEARGDPGDATLQGHRFDRLASPLILRPLACGDRAVGLALVLDAPRFPPGGLKLDPHQGTFSPELSAGEAARITRSNGSPLFPHGTTDPLAAFLSFLESDRR